MSEAAAGIAGEVKMEHKIQQVRISGQPRALWNFWYRQ